MSNLWWEKVKDLTTKTLISVKESPNKDLSTLIDNGQTLTRPHIDNGQILTRPQEIVNAFNNYFVNVASDISVSTWYKFFFLQTYWWSWSEKCYFFLIL